MNRLTHSLPGRLILLFCCLVAAAFASSPEGLRDAYLRWRGGDAFQGLQNRHFGGNIKLSTLTLPGTFERWDDCSGRSRIDVNAGSLKVSERLSLKAGFSITPGGQVETIPEEDCQSRLFTMLSFYSQVLTGAQGARLSALPSVAEGDKSLDGFRLTFPNGNQYDYFLKSEGELVRCRELIDGHEKTTTFGDWRIVNGVRLPYRMESVSKGDGQTIVYEVTHDALNESLDASLFSKPEEESRVSFEQGALSSGALSFDLVNGNRLFISGTAGGKQAIMMLDSAAEVSVLDSEFARTAGIKATGSMDIQGMGGSQKAEVSSDVILAVGKMRLRTGLVILMDMTQITQMIGRPVQVILGKEVLNQTVTDIDFEAHSICFHQLSSFAPPAGMSRIPLKVSAGSRSVAISVEGHDPVSADFDLGNGGALLLYPAAVESWGLLKGRPIAHRLGGGVGGLHTQNVFSVKTLTIGGITLRDVPVQSPVTAEGLPLIAMGSVQGNVGIQVWSRFHLILDFGHDQVFLAPAGKSLERPFAKNRSGITVLRQGDALKVLYVDPSFPKSICAANEEILAVNDVPVNQLRSTTEWTEAPAGTRVKLTFRDGHSAELILQETY